MGCHNLSFIEDYSYIAGIRLEQQYRFQIEPETLRFARDDCSQALGRLSYNRIQQELG